VLFLFAIYTQPNRKPPALVEGTQISADFAKERKRSSIRPCYPFLCNASITIPYPTPIKNSFSERLIGS